MFKQYWKIRVAAGVLSVAVRRGVSMQFNAIPMEFQCNHMSVPASRFVAAGLDRIEPYIFR